MARVRKKQSSFTSEEHDILDGRAKLLRVRASGDVWQFRMWVETEGKYVRKSLKTRDFDTAKEKAEEMVFQTMSDISSGRKIFGITLGELVQEYISWRQEDVEIGNITAGRLVTIRSQMKHLVAYKSSDLKMAELSRNSVFDYANWRKKEKIGVRDVTIRNEQSTINHMMGMAWRKGYSHFDKFDFRKIKIDEKEEVKRRGIFTLEEYDRLVRFMRKYVSVNECADEQERLERLLIRDCVLIGSNTMMRVGELWALKWGDIESIRSLVSAGGKETSLVTINVRAETAKNRRSRTVISRGGEYVLRLKERATHTGADDFVFASIGGKAQLTRQKYYLHWKCLMDGIGIDHKKRNITWYSLRHFGITCRLRAGVSHFEISKNAGTGIGNIEHHYGHIDTSMLTKAALMDFTVEKDGFSLREELTR
jgi:integrase